MFAFECSVISHFVQKDNYLGGATVALSGLQM